MPPARTPYAAYPGVGELGLRWIEVGKLSKQRFHPLRLLNAFWWMNPLKIEPTVRNVTPGIIDLMRAALVVPGGGGIRRGAPEIAGSKRSTPEIFPRFFVANRIEVGGPDR